MPIKFFFVVKFGQSVSSPAVTGRQTPSKTGGHDIVSLNVAIVEHISIKKLSTLYS